MRAQLRLTHENLPEYLKDRGLALLGEPPGVEAAGDGNIDCGLAAAHLGLRWLKTPPTNSEAAV